MKSPKHTPGPWKLLNPTRRAPHRYTVCASHPNGIESTHVCTTEAIDLVTENEAEANARLIAAAPDCLLALETIVKAFPTEKLSGHQQLAIGRAINAIAKATGGQNE